MDFVTVFISYLLMAISILVIYCICYRWQHRRAFNLMSKIPGPSPFHVMGICMKGIERLMYEVEQLHRQYPLITGGMFFFVQPFIFIHKPEVLQVVLHSQDCLGKPKQFRHLLKNSFGDGLLVAKVPKWRRHRKIILPSFGQKILDSFMVVFVEESEKLVKELEKQVGSEYFNIAHYIERATLFTICGTAMGVQMNNGVNEKNYINAILSLFKNATRRLTNIWMYPDFIFNLTPYGAEQRRALKIINDFTDQVISEKQKKLLIDDNNNDLFEAQDVVGGRNPLKKPFLDFIMEHAKTDPLFMEEDIRGEVLMFTVAGYETSAKTNSYVLLCLAANPSIQDKVYEELYEIFGDSDRPIDLVDLPRMQYLEMVIKETLRLFPTVPYITRETTAEIVLDNYRLPVGTSIAISIIQMHHNEKYWDHPNKFDPDRFLPENSAKRHPYTFLPFAAGPRNCIGHKYAMMAMKTLLAYVLRTYEIHTYLKLEELDNVFEVMLTLKGGHQVTISRRRPEKPTTLS